MRNDEDTLVLVVHKHLLCQTPHGVQDILFLIGTFAEVIRQTHQVLSCFVAFVFEVGDHFAVVVDYVKLIQVSKVSINNLKTPECYNAKDVQVPTKLQ